MASEQYGVMYPKNEHGIDSASRIDYSYSNNHLHIYEDNTHYGDKPGLKQFAIYDLTLTYGEPIFKYNMYSFNLLNKPDVKVRTKYEFYDNNNNLVSVGGRRRTRRRSAKRRRTHRRSSHRNRRR